MTISPHPESDTSWMEWGRKMLSGTLELLDKRSESMLTLIGALIAVQFGVILAFDKPIIIANASFVVKLLPQAFLAVSAACFGMAYFPIEKKLNLNAPFDLEEKYDELKVYKLKWHKRGYRWFVAGLALIAISYLLSPYSPPESHVQTINGTLALSVQ